MAFASFNTLSSLLLQLAAMEKQSTSAPSGAYWTPLATLALQRATNRIYAALVARGWTPALIAGWDLGPETEMTLACVFALTDAGMLEAADKSLLERYDSILDPEKGLLATVLLTVGGVWKPPDDTPGTVSSGNPAPGPCEPCHWSAGDFGIRW